MNTTPGMLGADHFPQGGLVRAAVWAALSFSVASTQAQDEGSEGSPAETTARVTFTAGVAELETEPLPDLTSPPSLPPLDGSAASASAAADQSELYLEQVLIETGLERPWSGTSGAAALAEAPVGFMLDTHQRAAVDPLRARTDRWATGLFSRDATLLTPLGEGNEILSWDLTDRLTLSGVGSPRVWDYRERAFVVSAEAGLQLSPSAGLHVGYEVLQASTSAGIAPELAGESLFAKFQLRF